MTALATMMMMTMATMIPPIDGRLGRIQNRKRACVPQLLRDFIFQRV
jgi:hypothetical protein